MSDQSELEYLPAPSWPKVVGILSTIFGIFAITCGVGGIGLLFVSDQTLGSMMGAQLPEGVPPPPMSPPMDALIIASLIVGILVNILLIAAGIALLCRRPSGRSLHLVYALLAVVAGFFSAYAGYESMTKQEQALDAWIEQHGDTEIGQQLQQQQFNQAGMQQTIKVVNAAFGLAIALAWPMFCIIWFGLVKRDHESMLGVDHEFA